MTVFTLLAGQTTNQTTPLQKYVVQPTSTNLGQPSTYQAFTATVTGSGSVTATVQPQVSNDGVNWSAYGTPITLSGTAPQTGNTTAQVSFSYWAATVTNVSGTNASVSCLMSA